VAFPWRRMTSAPPPEANIRAVNEQSGVCRVWLSGRITIDSSPELRVFLLVRLQSPKCESLTVDFSEVVYIDTSGLAVLVELLKAARNTRKTFQISGLHERPRYLLETSRLLHLFHEVESELPPSDHDSSLAGAR